ncbi:hydantoin utilization protein HyuB [Haladaptatus sp. W1]|uniref:hydantoinase B/oxoprolinase family protein n=1 Tax=Haladaptatus sp. W1 TaxID=1897478 RepID=UPI00084972D5|nr:hydantoinase B/oxoprolinase family protein [Haladaptatus sp. W1]ODR83488.1 hydantoin utilization protein HyuB [Haladaptatus sp. W1]
MITDDSDKRAEEQRGLLEERELDPVTLQVIGGEFDTIAEEMGSKMIRSSYSSIIRESEDIGAGIFTPECEEVAESDYTPMHVGSLPGYLRGMYKCIEERGEDVFEITEPGDVYFHNHPYYGASHSPDIAVIVPIFYDDELVGWSADTAHILDIGTATPGITIDLYDVYAEGQLFKARKVISQGERIKQVWDHIHDNTRTPRMNEGDLQAMISAAEIGRQRYVELIEKYGLETVQQAGDDLISYAEDLLRSKVAELPDGEWHETAYLDDDGRNRDKRIKIDVKVRVEGDAITIDLTDSNDQVPTGFNCPVDGATKVAAYFTLRALLMDTYVHDEYIPQNSGTFEPINVETRKGSIFDPNPPAAAFARINQVDMMGDLIVKALRNAVPDRVMAGNAAQVFFTSYSGPEPDSEGDEYWVYLEVNDGSYGGRPDKDGIDCVGALIHNTRNRPVEDIELSHPMRVDRYELREDGHGAGEFRGGHGVCRETTFLIDTVMSTEGDGKHHTPWGAFGGEEGAGASMWHIRTDDPDGSTPVFYSQRDQMPDEMDYGSEVNDVDELYTKVTGYQFEPGDHLIVKSAMSGGYGDPHDRPVEKVFDDYRDGLINEEIAREDYGVVIEDGEVDHDATADLRDR